MNECFRMELYRILQTTVKIDPPELQEGWEYSYILPHSDGSYCASAVIPTGNLDEENIPVYLEVFRCAETPEKACEKIINAIENGAWIKRAIFNHTSWREK